MNEIKCKTKINEKNEFSIENYDEIRGAFLELAKDPRFDLIVSNDEDLKVIKQFRTEIRKRNDAIKDGRLTINQMYFGTFNNQAKDLEKLLQDYDLKLKEKVEKYNEEFKGQIKAKKFKIIIETTDPRQVEKLKAFCLKNNLNYKED